MRGKRGQAAFEYLTTYGWVFLVILITLGTLIYFGFFDPDNFTPDRCWFGSQLMCEDYAIERTNPAQSQLMFRVRNNMVKPVDIVGISGLDVDYPLSGCSTSVDVGVGEIVDLSCDIDAQLFRGDKYSIPLVITFSRNATGNPPEHNISGEVYTTAR